MPVSMVENMPNPCRQEIFSSRACQQRSYAAHHVSIHGAHQVKSIYIYIEPAAILAIQYATPTNETL